MSRSGDAILSSGFSILEHVCMLREVTSEDYVQLHFEYFLFQKLNNLCDTPMDRNYYSTHFRKKIGACFLAIDYGAWSTGNIAGK